MKNGLVLVAALWFLSPVYAQTAQEACQAKAVSKDGKLLAGAAKNAFMKKCLGETKVASCEERAVSKDGKKLAGAAKNSFIKKCESASEVK